MWNKTRMGRGKEMRFTSADLLKAMGLKLGSEIVFNKKKYKVMLNVASHRIEAYCEQEETYLPFWFLIDEEFEIIQPKQTLTEDENSFLKVSYNNGYRYLAKDRNEKICRISKEKPIRLCDEYWATNNDINHFYLNIFPSLFQFIKWEDEPYSIEELLKENQYD